MRTGTLGVLAILGLVMLAACGSSPSGPQEIPPVEPKAYTPPPPFELAENQIVIGERIEFAGADGEPILAPPGIYRVETGEKDTLSLFFGRSKAPISVAAEKGSLTLEEEQKGHLTQTKVVLLDEEDSPQRELCLLEPDGTTYRSTGFKEGERSRASLLNFYPRRYYYYYTPPPSPPSVTLTSPVSSEVYWNRLSPLTVRWTSTGLSSSSFRVYVTQRVSGRSIAYRVVVGSSTSIPLTHVDPGLYDVMVTDYYRNVQDTHTIRVTGATRSLSGAYHFLALGPDTASGPYDDYVWSWGSNIRGECGTGVRSAGDGNLSVPFENSIGLRARAVAAGTFHSVCIGADGLIYTWGENEAYELGRHAPLGYDASPKPISYFAAGSVIQVAANNATSYALRSDGTVWAWGANGRGECAQGHRRESVHIPVPVRDYSGQVLSGVVAIAASHFHALALRSDGSLWGWGLNTDGQLDSTVGIGDDRLRAIPLWKDWTAQVRVRGIVAGEKTSFAVVLTSTGSIHLCGWGANPSGLIHGMTSASRLTVPTALYPQTSWDDYIVGCGKDVLAIGEPGGRRVAIRGRDANLSLQGILATEGTDSTVAVKAWEWGSYPLPSRPVLYVWGRNSYGLLGVPYSQTPSVSTPIKHEFR